MITSDFVRTTLVAIWGRQACQSPANWPETLEQLLQGTAKHASVGPAIEEATAVLTATFAARSAADPVASVWRAFPRLDRAHCTELAELLAAEAVAAGPALPEDVSVAA